MIRSNIDSIYMMMDPVSTDRDVFQHVVNFLCSLAGVQYTANNRDFAISVLKRLLEVSKILPNFFDQMGDADLYKQFY